MLIPFAYFIVKIKKLLQKPSMAFIWTLPFKSFQVEKMSLPAMEKEAIPKILWLLYQKVAHDCPVKT
jgi:hypothetical protein